MTYRKWPGNNAIYPEMIGTQVSKLRTFNCDATMLIKSANVDYSTKATIRYARMQTPLNAVKGAPKEEFPLNQTHCTRTGTKWQVH